MSNFYTAAMLYWVAIGLTGLVVGFVQGYLAHRWIVGREKTQRLKSDIERCRIGRIK